MKDIVKTVIVSQHEQVRSTLTRSWNVWYTTFKVFYRDGTTGAETVRTNTRRYDLLISKLDI